MEENKTGIKSIKNLFKNEELYQILIENRTDAVFFSENSIIVDCHEAAVKLFGFTSKGEFKGKFPFDFSPERQPDGKLSKEKARHYISESLKKMPQHFHWQYSKSDGTLFGVKVVLNSFNCLSPSLKVKA